MKTILLAAGISLVLSLFGTPLAIRLFARRGYGQLIREEGPESHLTKRGTPTMGGTVIVVASVAGYLGGHLLTDDPMSASGLLVLMLMAGLGLVGFLDDFIKIYKQRSLGLRSGAKLAGQAVVGALFAVLVLHYPDNYDLTPADAHISFLRDVGPAIGVVPFVFWIVLMIAGWSNAVNLTDGLDGLATGSATLVLAAYVLIANWQLRNDCTNAPIVAHCYAVASPLDLAVVAARTPGFVGADLANLVNEAALLTARKGKPAVTSAELDEAIDRMLAGLEKKQKVMNRKEKEIVAYHETGHALMASLLQTPDPVHKISIIPRGIAALGYTMQRPTEDRYLMTKQELLDRLAVLLGGRVAEELTFGEVSTGAHDDLAKATDIVKSMVKEFGMSDKIGHITYEKERKSMFLDIGPDAHSRDYSEETAREIDNEIRRIIEDAYEQVKETLGEKKRLLEQIAGILLEKEVMDGEELRRLVREYEEKEGAAESDKPKYRKKTGRSR